MHEKDLAQPTSGSPKHPDQGSTISAVTSATKPSKSGSSEKTRSTAKNNGKPPERKPKGLFGALKDVLPVLALYSYFSGWIYAYAFFKAFRISLSSLDIPFQYFFMYSFSALASWAGILLILIVAGAVIALQGHKLVMVAVACLLFVGLFALAFAQGTADANQQRHSKTNDRVVLSFAEKAKQSVPPDLKVNNEADSLRLLAETKDHILVFHQDPPIAPGDIPPVLVYDVAKSDLVTISREVSDSQRESFWQTLWRIIHEQPSR